MANCYFREQGNSWIVALTSVFLSIISFAPPVSGQERINFTPVEPQFIAALGDPGASHGRGAQYWGLWSIDPGPRGVWLSMFPLFEVTGGYAPARWKFDSEEWWLDENGLLMEKPIFPLAPGRYLVTGEREVTTMLTIHAEDRNGDVRWELDNGATLYDVTHLPCRSARYTPMHEGAICSPVNAPASAFKVPPGSEMPQVPGCAKHDYSVLIVVGIEKP